MKTRLGYVLASAVLAASFGLRVLPASAENAPTPFKIGVIASLTGPFAAPSKDTLDGVKAWIKLHGLPGKTIQLEVLDDETNPVNASNIFRRLASDKSVKMIYMLGNSNSGLAIKSFASEFKVPIITGGGADTLGIPANPWDFKVAPSNKDNMKAIVLFAKKQGYKTIAHIYGTDSYGQLDQKNLVIQAKQAGIKLVSAESFDIADTNFNAQLARIKAANPDVIYSSGAGRAAILIFKTYKLLQIKAPLIVTQAAVTVAFYDSIGGRPKADGLLIGAQRGAFGTALGGATAKYFTELKNKIGHVPPFFTAFGYDIGIITAAGVPATNATRQNIRDHLEAIKNLPGLNGPITYTKTDHTGQDFRSITIGRLENGVAQVVK